MTDCTVTPERPASADDYRWAMRHLVGAVSVITAGRGDNGDLPPNQLGRQRRQPIVLALRPAVLDRHVLTLDEANFLQPIAECAQTVREGSRR